MKATGHALHTAAKATGHALVTAAKTSGKFLKAHAAAITAFAVSTLVFAGCEAALTVGSAGTLSVPGAVACGAAAGAASSLVEQGFKCAHGGKGACSAKAFATAGVTGGLAGAAGGVLGGLGGKVLGKLAPKALDAVGGLFGRGASEATESGAADLVDGVGGEEAQAARTAGSSADNPAESAGGGGRPSAGNEREPVGCGGPHSFVGSTPVLMAGGTVKPISEIRVGDRIVDGVPGQAGVRVHTVSRVIVTTTDHDFVDVTVKPVTGVPAHSAARAAGGVGVKALAGRVKAAAATVVLGAGVVAAGAGLSQVPSVGATLTTTFHHPFYDQTQHAFVDAKDLQPGDILQTPDGTAAVTAVRAYHATRPTYDLTIDGLHTYYVVAGNAAVLVHNCGGDVYANGGRTRYGSLDNLGRPTGVSASIDRSMIRT